MNRYARSFINIFFLWMLPCLLFSVFYFQKYSPEKEVIIMHVMFMACLACGGVSIVKILSILLPYKIYIPVKVTLLYVWFVWNIVMYVSMAVGLLSWGRIPTVEILYVYVNQLDGTLEAIGMSRWHLFFLMAIAFILVSAFVSAVASTIVSALASTAASTWGSSSGWSGSTGRASSSSLMLLIWPAALAAVALAG